MTVVRVMSTGLL